MTLPFSSLSPGENCTKETHRYRRYSVGKGRPQRDEEIGRKHAAQLTRKPNRFSRSSNGVP